MALTAVDGLALAAPEGGAPAAGNDASKAQGNAERLLLVPLGPQISDDELSVVEQALLAFYDFRLERHARLPLPEAAYYRPRQRYRAEKLLEFLDSIAERSYERVVGLTGVDISTTNGSIYDWGILGLATVDGRLAVLSTHRCARGTRTEAERHIRFGKVAVHEVGHTLGLPHCPTRGCLMEDARGSVLTTDREYDLCARCRNELRRLGRGTKPEPRIPWPKP
jgi:archaemetzincin